MELRASRIFRAYAKSIIIRLTLISSQFIVIMIRRHSVWQTGRRTDLQTVRQHAVAIPRFAVRRLKRNYLSHSDDVIVNVYVRLRCLGVETL